MKHFLFLLAGFFLTSATLGQKRVEVETSNGSDYTVVPVGELGVVFFYQTEERGPGRERIWEFRKLDTEFSPEWKKEVLIPKDFGYKEFYQEGDYVYLLFLDQGGKTAFKVLKFDVKTGNHTHHNGITPTKLEYVDFKVSNDRVFVGTNQRASTMGQCCRSMCFPAFFCLAPFGISPVPSHGMFIHHDMKRNTTKILAPNVRGNSVVQDVKVNDENGAFTVLLQDWEDRNPKLSLRNFSNSGENAGTIVIKSGGEHGLKDGRVAYSQGKEQIILGSYSESQSKRVNFSKSGINSAGVYFTKVIDGKQKFIKYHKFTDFENFFSYLGERSQQRVERRMNRRKNKGKDLNVGYNLLIHDLIVKDDELIFVAEAYYAEYHTETYYTTDANGRLIAQTRQVFDGYRYTHAIVAGFNQEGQLLWNNTFRIWDILTRQLKERVQAISENGKLTLVYSNGGKIRSKIIEGSQVIDGKESKPIPTFGEDKVKSNWNSDVLPWYQNKFLCYGYQRIKSQDQQGKSKRNVFYFTQVSY